MKEEEYLRKLLAEATLCKRLCLQKIRDTYGDNSQTFQRKLSWAYSAQFGSLGLAHLPLTPPWPLAKSNSDIYHHTHLIRATLCCVFLPDPDFQSLAPTVAPLAYLASTELERVENLALVYQSVAQAIDAKPTIQKGTKLDELLNLAKETLSNVRDIRERLEGVDPSRDPGSELVAKKQKRSKRKDNNPTG